MKSCLIVDDSRVVRKVARRIAEDLGFSCEEAEDGQKAYEACQASMPDAVLLDWNMPVMDGLTFLKELRKLNLPKQPKVVMCTTENEMSSIVEAMQNGADEFIMKPFNNDIVREKLEVAGVL